MGSKASILSSYSAASKNEMEETSWEESDGPRPRLLQFWGGRSEMSQEELFSTVFTHPYISDCDKQRIYEQFCRKAPRLGYEEFASAISWLEAASPVEKQAFLRGCTSEMEAHGTSKMTAISSSSSGHDKSDESNGTAAEIFTFHQVLAGVTHCGHIACSPLFSICPYVIHVYASWSRLVEESEIAAVKNSFDQLSSGDDAGATSLYANEKPETTTARAVRKRVGIGRICAETFESHLLGIAPRELITSLFRAFDEDHDGLIDLKEFVCGLSALCRGPDSARLKFIIRAWDSTSSGRMCEADLRSFCTTFHIADEKPTRCFTTFPVEPDEVVCWLMRERPKLVTTLLQLSRQIGLLGLGLNPTSPGEQLEVICDVKQQPPWDCNENLIDLWCVVPWVWWSQIVVALNPRSYTGEIPPLDNSSILATVEWDEDNGKVDHVLPILRPGLRARIDYELLPKFLFKALLRWNRVAPITDGNLAAGKASPTPHPFMSIPVERCTLNSEVFPLEEGQEDERMQKGPHWPFYVELYPPVVQLLRHSLAENTLPHSPYTIWKSGVTISRRTTVGEIKQAICERLSSISAAAKPIVDKEEFSRALDPSELRLWLLKANGESVGEGGSPLPMLVDNNLASLHILGVRQSAQLLVEVQNEDRSWPEELLQLARENGELYSKGKKRDRKQSVLPSAAQNAAIGGVVNMGNTCYMSAAVQTLGNVSPLTECLLAKMQPNGGKDVADEAGESAQKRLGPIAVEYSSLLREIYGGAEGKGPSAVAPKKLKEIIARRTTRFGDRLQHDCQEFLQTLLDTLHGDLLASSTAEHGAAMLEEKSKCAESKAYEDSFKAWLAHTEREGTSIVSLLFNGQLQSHLRCRSCSHLSTTYEVFTCLQLPVPIDDNLLIHVNVIRLSMKGFRLAFRLPATKTMVDLKEAIASHLGISASILHWLLRRDPKGEFKSESLTPGSSEEVLLGNVPWNNVTAYAYELAEKPSNGNQIIVAMHRRILRTPMFAISGIDDFKASVVDTPLAFTTPSSASGKSLYHHVNALVQRLLPFDGDRALGLSSANRATDASEDSRSGHPFRLCPVLWAGGAQWCASCHWSKYCHGCAIDPQHDGDDNDAITTLHNSEQAGVASSNGGSASWVSPPLLAIDWKPAAFYLRYCRITEIDFADDESVAVCSRLHAQPLSLSKCLSDFTSIELLTDSKCDECKQVAEREKGLALWRVPKILVIHLKRFVYDERRGAYVKCTRPVEFPLEKFNPMNYSAGNDQLRNVVKSSSYDCIAIVNHHGTIHSGHYTSYIRRILGTNRWQWYFCNDSHTMPISEEAINKREAYLLFYQHNNGGE